jgi:hypothetical protein
MARSKSSINERTSGKVTDPDEAPLFPVIASAEQADAEHVYSEDLSDGQVIAGITIVNPLIDR